MIIENKVWKGLFYDGAYKNRFSKSLLGHNIVIMIILYAAQCNKVILIYLQKICFYIYQF